MSKKASLIIGAVIFVLAIVGVSVYLLLKPTNPTTEASPQVTPQQIKITNISDNSFTVSWVTPDTPTSGYIEYGINDKLGSTAQDDRGGAVRLTHHVTVKSLTPSTQYYYKIVLGSSKFDNGGAPYTITTASTTTNTPPVPDTAFGKITPQGDDVLVYVNFENGSPLSTTTAADGNWLISLNNARNTNLTDYLTTTPDTRVSFTATNGKLTSQGSFAAANKAPVPTVNLGQNIVLASVNLTPTPQATAQGAPVASISPTPISTVSPSPLVSPKPSVSPSPSPKIATQSAVLPESGEFENTVLFAGGGLLILIIGIAIAL